MRLIRRSRTRLAVAATAALLVASAGVASAAVTPTSPSSRNAAGAAANPSQTVVGEAQRRVSAANQVAAGREGWVSWALLDRRTGAVAASSNATEPNNTESFIKVWIAADALRRAQQSGGKPSAADQQLIDVMIRNSDDKAAQTFYDRNGGDALIQSMIDTCKLSTTTVYAGMWSYTQMPARDAVAMLDCVFDGRSGLDAASLQNLLRLMKSVSTDGSFGIYPALPLAYQQLQPPQKNGWTAHWKTDSWNLNCTALLGSDYRYALAIETRYPQSLGQEYGAESCEMVTRALLPSTGA